MKESIIKAICLGVRYAPGCQVQVVNESSEHNCESEVFGPSEGGSFLCSIDTNQLADKSCSSYAVDCRRKALCAIFCMEIKSALVLREEETINIQ